LEFDLGTLSVEVYW